MAANRGIDECERLLSTHIPQLEGQIYDYIMAILSGSIDDFRNGEDIYDAVGSFMEQFSNINEKDIRSLCDEMHELLMKDKPKKKSSKLLEAPVHLASITESEKDGLNDVGSIWSIKKDETSKVNSKKLEKAELKLLQKADRRTNEISNKPIKLEEEGFAAVVTQSSDKKNTRLDAKGANNTKDIKIEEFDIAYGNKCLISGADLCLAYGRRYGLVGRNGLGKSTLLKAISSGTLQIPCHITILHVEQEVIGDDTTALESVLVCDEKRESLLAEERDLTGKINSGDTDQSLSQRLTEIYHELQHIEADKAPARASIILAGLGFSPEMQIKPTKEFSGGWRMRIALARALFSKPDLLLLDEPTNMLDIKPIIWLESYLQTWSSTILVVSHDRQFLDSVPTDILHLHSQRLEHYKGNYSHYLKVKTEKMKHQQREYESQQQFRAHAQEFIDKFRYNAKRASLVQSKIKQLEKLPELKPVEKEVEVTLKFPEAELLSPPILQLDEVNFGYTKDKMVLKNLSLSANMDSRICIVGENGAGKTTLLKVLLGVLDPTSGIRHAHRNLKFGYFTQHHVDQLDMSVSSVELLQQKFPGKSSEEYRRHLGGFGVTGDLALQKVSLLSGGQKSRVAFALMCMYKPNFLILDEPTNHLDVETIEALGAALHKYNGGLILVSHDERLIRAVCTELWVCHQGNISSVEGGFEEYRKIVEKELESQS